MGRTEKQALAPSFIQKAFEGGRRFPPSNGWALECCSCALQKKCRFNSSESSAGSPKLPTKLLLQSLCVHPHYRSNISAIATSHVAVKSKFCVRCLNCFNLILAIATGIRRTQKHTAIIFSSYRRSKCKKIRGVLFCFLLVENEYLVFRCCATQSNFVFNI